MQAASNGPDSLVPIQPVSCTTTSCVPNFIMLGENMI